MGVASSYSSPQSCKPPSVCNARFGRRPVPFQSVTLSEEVLGYLQTACAFDAHTPEEHYPMLGFKREVDYSETPDHIFYDCHCHTMPTRKPILSFQTRQGKIVDKPSGSRQLRSFGEALRHCNNAFSETLLELLHSIPANKCARAMANIIKANRLFGDANITLNYGEAVTSEQVHRRYGSYCSIINLTLSVKGKFVILVDAKDTFRNIFSPELKAGKGYFSNPFVLKQGIVYPQCPWSKRIIIVHFRMLLNSEEVQCFLDATEEELLVLMDVVAKAQKSNPLLLPTLQEVLLADTDIQCPLLTPLTESGDGAETAGTIFSTSPMPTE